MAKNYLVTGVAGTGKSTLKEIFSGKGYETVDLDEGYAHWANRHTGKPADEKGSDETFFQENDWMLNAPKFEALITDERPRPLMVFGTTYDLKKKTDLFDRVFLLGYPDEESLMTRLAARTTGFGSTPEERANVLLFYKEEQDAFSQLGAVCIDCTLRLEHVVEKIEHEIHT